MAGGTYGDHADIEGLWKKGIAFTATSTPSDALVDALWVQAERMTELFLARYGKTNADANNASANGFKGILVELVLYWLKDQIRVIEAGASQTAGPEGRSYPDTNRAIPQSIKKELIDLIADRDWTVAKLIDD